MSEKAHRVSVIVLNYNGLRHLEACLSSVLRSSYPDFEVILVDNASTDASVDFVQRRFPQVCVVRNSSNLGFAEGNNVGIENARGEYILLLNNDTEVDRNWMTELARVADLDTHVGGFTGKIMMFYDRERINQAGGSCDIFGAGWNKGNGEIDRGQYDHPREVFFGTGGFLLFRRSVWNEVGPFDKEYFAYAEDLDWCWRLRLRGYKVLCIPSAVIYHKWRGSWKRTQMINLLERNWLTTLIKNYGLNTLARILPRYLALKSLKTLWLMVHGGPSEGIAVLKAVWWNLANLREVWAKRTKIQSTRKVSDSEVQRHMFKGSFELLLWSGRVRHPILNDYPG